MKDEAEEKKNDIKEEEDRAADDKSKWMRTA
jgi:hypothetical protein